MADKADRADALPIDADCRPRLVSHRAGLPFQLHYAPVRTGLTAQVKALTAALAQIIDNGDGSRLRACSLAGCGTVSFICCRQPLWILSRARSLRARESRGGCW